MAVQIGSAIVADRRRCSDSRGRYSALWSRPTEVARSSAAISAVYLLAAGMLAVGQSGRDHGN